MRLKLYRIASGNDSTLGVMLGDNWQAFTCEDEYREEKILGETRIPAGIYKIKLRDAGGMNEKYKARYPFHKGMLHLQDVPNFKYIYIHTGNDQSHTDGCILVGYGSTLDKPDGGGFVSRSREAYADLYQAVMDYAERDELEIEVIDSLN